MYLVFGERRPMVVLTYSAAFVILEKEKPMVMLASSAGSLVLKKSEADGDGGFLCYFLRSGRVKSRWWLNSSVGVAFSDGHSAPLFDFAFSLLSLFLLTPSASLFSLFFPSISLPSPLFSLVFSPAHLCFSPLHSPPCVFFPFSFVVLSPFSGQSPSCFLFFSSLVLFPFSGQSPSCFLFFSSLVLFSPLFYRLSLTFISQRMSCGATFSLVMACRGIVAVKHSP